MTDEKNESKQQRNNEKAGSMAGVGAGALTGAQLGTVLVPIPVVGTFTGALVGGVLGSRVEKKLGGAVLNALDSKKRAEETTSKTAQPDITLELERLGQLRAQGLLTDEEFSAAKAKLLNL